VIVLYIGAIDDNARSANGVEVHYVENAGKLWKMGRRLHQAQQRT